MRQTFIAFTMFFFSTWQQPTDPNFSQGFSKYWVVCYAELAHRLLRENWVYALPPPLSLSLGSTQGTGSQLSRASPMPSPGVMPLPGVELWDHRLSSYKVAFLLFLLLKLAQMRMHHKHILTFPDYSQHVYEKSSWSCKHKTKLKSVCSCWPLGWRPPQTLAAALHLCWALTEHLPSVRSQSDSSHVPASV